MFKLSIQLDAQTCEALERAARSTQKTASEWVTECVTRALAQEWPQSSLAKRTHAAMRRALSGPAEDVAREAL